MDYKRTSPILYIHHLNITKGLAILSVIVFHIYMGKYRSVFYHGVDIFFLISGLGLTLSALTKSKVGDKYQFRASWFKRRLLRIYPLYFIALTIAFFAYYFDLNPIIISSTTSNVYLDFFLHALLLHVYNIDTYFSLNIAWWFIGILLQFYLLFPLLYKILNKYESSLMLIIGSVISVSFLFGIKILLPTFDVANKLIDIYLSQVLTGLFFFFQGMILAKIIFLDNYEVSPKTQIIILAICVSMILLIPLFPSVHYEFLSYSLNIIVGLSFAAFIYIISFRLYRLFSQMRHTNKLIDLLNGFGISSYAIYLTHMFMVSILGVSKSSFIRTTIYLLVVLAVGHYLTKIDLKLKSILKC